MLSWTWGSNWARWNEPIVGSIVSSSPLTTRTGLSTVVSPAGELRCSHFASAVSWAPIVSLDTAASRSWVRSSRRLRNASAAAWLLAVGEKNRKCFGYFPEHSPCPARSEVERLCRRVPVTRRCGAGQKDAANQIGLPLNYLLGDHAPPGKTQQGDRAQPERLQEGDRVAGHRLDGVGSGAAGAADAAQVDQDDAPLAAMPSTTAGSQSSSKAVKWCRNTTGTPVVCPPHGRRRGCPRP